MANETVERPDYYDSLEGSCEYAWRLMARGVADRRHGFHHPALATIGLNGAPKIRTVILRAASVASRELTFHTDYRSEKIRELTQDPRISVHLYDEASKLQLRLEGRATLHEGDAVARSRWEASRPMSRVCYTVSQGPGTRIDTGDAYSLDKPATSAEAPDDHYFENFAAIVIKVWQMDWLYLANAGHRRAKFLWLEDGSREMGWLVP